MTMNHELIPLAITVNGTPVVRESVRADMLLVDFLHEELGLTGTKFSCGVGSCGSCKVAAAVEPGSPLMPLLACYARLRTIDGLHITTVEGLGGAESLHPLQEAFLDEYAFQCGFSTPGFLMAAYVLMDELRRAPVSADRLDATILAAIEGNLCRCTGYVRYFEAIRKVIRGTPGLVTPEGSAPGTAAAAGIWFRLMKRSSNDLHDKPFVGRFERPYGQVTFVGTPSFDTCTAWIVAPAASIHTGEPVRDLNLARFFFHRDARVEITVTEAWPLDRRLRPDLLPLGCPIPFGVAGEVSIGPATLSVETELIGRVLSAGELGVVSRTPIRFDPRDLGLPILAFGKEFGLRLSAEVEVTLDVALPYVIL